MSGESPGAPGRVLVATNVVGTVFVVAGSVAATVAPAAFTLTLIVVSLVAFAAGTAAFLAAYAIAISRSRHDAIGMGGLYFLAGSAPRRTQVVMLGCWAVQIVVAVVAASLQVFTGVAFVLLAPMLGIGLAGLWGARHGEFAPRKQAA